MASLLADNFEGTAEEAVEVGGQGFVFGYGLLDGFFCGGALVAEVGESGEDVVYCCALNGGLDRGYGEVVELVFEFDDEALGELFANAGDADELGVVLAANGLDGALGGEAAEYLDGQFGADAADGDEALEEALFLAIEEAEEGDLVFADLGMDVEGGFCADAGEGGEGGDGDDDVVAYAGGFDDGLAGFFEDELAAEVSDHSCLLASVGRIPIPRG